MDKEAKKMNYSIDVTKTIKLTDGIIDGMTKKKAAALKGTWIKLNPTSFALVEESNLTVVRIVKDEIGCACRGFTDADTSWMCEHLIAFKDLKNDPQVSIQSPEYRWLQAYLFSKGWSSNEDRWVYPSLDAPTVEPEVVAELPPVEEEEPPAEEKTYSRKCQYCGEILRGTDLAQVKLDIAEHIRGCPKNPANKKKSPRLVTQTVPEADVKESLTTEKPTVAKSAPVEKPLKKEEKKAESPQDVTREPEAIPKTIAEAMCNMQKTELFAITDSDNPFFKSKYADLASIWSAIRKPLTDNGLAVIQTTEPYNGGITVITTLLHVSGETYHTKLSAKADKQTIQGLGSLITYLRRYSLAALVGVASADDDGEAASGRGTKDKR